mmetsp:Transcript_15274/g.36152  ORF Transcript_15274/g.36152 Transcript_15274/m.36152 type:complete len:541 (+) Transcript_15274:1266-2888(+)
MKRTLTKLMMSWKNDEHGSINQRWLVRDCPTMSGYFNLFSEAFPARALAATMQGTAELREFRPSAHCQVWRLTPKGQLVSKLREAQPRGLAIRHSQQGSSLKVERLQAMEERQSWTLRPSSGGAFLLECNANGLVADLAGDYALSELHFLARWAEEPGLVPLRHVVCGPDALSSPIIIKRLNKQLGPGMKCDDLSTECVLKDMHEGKIRRRTPRQAAQQLLQVGRFLARMHQEGFAHNDLHSGNVLRSSGGDNSRFSVIDLGATCQAGYWQDVLGEGYDEGWCITRDWRAFASHLASLIDGEPRILWDLVGSQDCLPFLRTAWASPRYVRPCAAKRTGKVSQQWEVDEQTGRIINKYSGHALQTSRTGSSIVLAAPSNKESQQFVISGGYIQNVESMLCLEVQEGRVVAAPVRSSQSQQWRFDPCTGEILNPASDVALDVQGPARLPRDVAALRRRGARFGALLEALFRPRCDPAECLKRLEAVARQRKGDEGHLQMRFPKFHGWFQWRSDISKQSGTRKRVSSTRGAIERPAKRRCVGS